MNQHRVILPIFSNPTRNNTRLLRTNRIRLPQVHKTQILPRNRLGSQSQSVSSLVCQDYKRECEVAEEAYKAKRDKELAMRELEFLIIDPSELPSAKRAIIERKQAEMK
ncbi:hypothetical protein Tco_1166034 [Tanacetum coccineum]